MAVNKENYKKLVEGARAEGISDEDIRGYLTLTKTATGKNKEIFNRLLQENNIWLTDMLQIEEKQVFLDEIMGKETPNQENNHSKTLSEKARTLMEKIDLLSQRIEQEKSPLKRHILAFKVKMLIAKIQREIDLQNLRASYEDKRTALLTDKEDRENSAIDNIAILNSKIKTLQREMSGNEEYDAESPYFMYPKNYVQDSGGVENLTKKLKESKKVESQQAAKRIEEMAIKRQELNQLYEELKQEQESLEYSQGDYEQDMNDLDKEEKSLVIRQRLNIFTRIGDFFKGIVQEAKLYREEKAQIKDLRVKQKEDESVIDEEFNRKMQELREEREKAKQQLRESQRGERENQQNQLGQDTAADFRKQMAEMGKTELNDSITPPEEKTVDTHREEATPAPEEADRNDSEELR